MIQRTRFLPRPTLFALAVAMGPAFSAVPAAETKAQVQVEVFTLDNGMKFLLVKKPELTTVSAGWVAHVGSSNERPGITGLTHLFEHMMFKGTHALGTKDIARDLQIIEEQEQLQEKIRKIYNEQRARWRRGEIDDPFSVDNRTPELAELQKQFQVLVDEQRSLMIKDEFDKVYTEAGGSNMNAFTNADMTVYFITVPANKLELWFWMESDRLYNLVLREFYSERDVVHEERRLRTESTPTGKYDELFEAMIWQAHPYGWPVIGWPSDLRVISKEQAEEYYRIHYAPNNVTAALVGNFDPAQVKELAKKYFGRAQRGAVEPPSVVTLEIPQLASQKLTAECDCQPETTITYKTVPFNHKDSFALDVLSGLMNGRTGRLYKSLVLDKKIATSAGVRQNSQKWAGSFSFNADTKGEATPEQLEQAWYEELKKIQDEPIPAEELQKVKNQTLGTSFRRLENPFFLLIQLLLYDGLGDWTYLNTWTDRTLAVTEADVKRVAKEYFAPEKRNLALYYRKAGSAAEEVPPEIAELPAEMQGPVKNQFNTLRQQVAGINDPAQLRQMLSGMEARKAQSPPQFQKIIPLFQKIIEERLAQLPQGDQAPAAGGAK